MKPENIFDKNFFFNEDDLTYYFYGFMLGDGCLITHKQGHKYITITLNAKDQCILHNICKWTKRDLSSIKYYKNNTLCRLEYYGNFFKENNFSKYGLVSNKTYNPIIPNISQKYLAPFLIGLIDADGSISFNTERKNLGRISKEYNFNIVGNIIIMDWFVDKIHELGFTGHINSQLIKKDFKRIRIQRKNDILQLSKILSINNYRNIYLKRKWENLDFYNMSCKGGIA